MFTFIGFLLISLLCIFIGIMGICWVYVSFIFSDRTSLIYGVILLVISAFLGHSLYNNSPYSITSKNNESTKIERNSEINKK